MNQRQHGMDLDREPAIGRRDKQASAGHSPEFPQKGQSAFHAIRHARSRHLNERNRSCHRQRAARARIRLQEANAGIDLLEKGSIFKAGRRNAGLVLYQPQK